MNRQNATVSVQMDSQLKREAKEVLGEYGLTTAYAVRTLFRRIVAEQAFPLDLKVPNQETQDALMESREMMRRAIQTYGTMDGAWEDEDSRR